MSELPGTFGTSICERFSKLQLEKLVYETELARTLCHNVRSLPPPTLKQKLKTSICNFRIMLAKKIAGDDWPEEY